LKFVFDNFNDCTATCEKIEEISFPEDKKGTIIHAFAFKHFIPYLTEKDLF